MARITRIHFAGVGHHDARVPALTLDMRDRHGNAADTIIWAENGTGKSSLLNLIFSTYRPNQRQFLGKQAEGKARELPDYVRERDLGFIVTEWDITDDQRQKSLLRDNARAVLLVGQMLSWRGLDKSNELRRLFFTIKPNHVVQLQSLPILGLAQPVSSFEAFRDWLDEQNRAFPKLEIRYTSSQTEWQEHLANNQLDPELFTYQLRMNESEGGINNLFNALKSDRDFIRLFLQLGFDPSSANQVRDNLQQFLPKLRNRAGLELQLEFNEKVLQELSLFIAQLSICEDTRTRTMQAERDAGTLLAALRIHAEKFRTDAEMLLEQRGSLKAEETRLTSQRAAVTRKQNYFRNLKCHLEESEARVEFEDWQKRRALAEKSKRVIEMAIELAEVARIKAQADQMRAAIEREREQARPVLDALQSIGGQLRARLNEELAAVIASISVLETQHQTLREEISAYRDKETSLASERSDKQANLAIVDNFFAARDSERERLRREEWVASQETAAAALQNWYGVRDDSLQAQADSEKTRTAAIRENDELAQTVQTLVRQIASAENERAQLEKTVRFGESEEERVATHSEMRAAVESARADLNLPQAGECLIRRSESLLRRIVRINIEGAEDERTKAYFDKHSLFPPHRDVEMTVEKLNAAGVATATSALNWLAYNIADPQKAAELLSDDSSTFSGVMFDHQMEAERANAILPGLSTQQGPVTISALPAAVNSSRSEALGDHNRKLAGSVTLLPQHAGSFNFEAARTEVQKLETQQGSRLQELEHLKNQLEASRTLVDNFQAWVAEYGGAKLRILRERLHASSQMIDQLQEQQRNVSERKSELDRVTQEAHRKFLNAQSLKSRSETAIQRLENFQITYEEPYEIRSARKRELSARLQSIQVEQLSTVDVRKSKESQELGFTERMVAVQVQRRKIQDEILKIRYVRQPSDMWAQSIEELRASYDYQVRQYEGTFLNSKVQGELSAAEQRLIDMEDRLVQHFAEVDRTAATAICARRDLDEQSRSAVRDVAFAYQEQGKAEQKLIAAREALTQLPGISEQDRPTQAEILPRTSQDAAEELVNFEKQYSEIQAKLEDNRSHLEEVNDAQLQADKRSSQFKNHIQRLVDFSLPEAAGIVEMPAEEAQTLELVNENISRLQTLRKDRDGQDRKLQERYSAIQELTREDKYAKATELPARSLFAHMPLEELIACAAQKRGALEEEIRTIRADLDLLAQHRETLVTSLLNVSKQAVQLLKRAEKWSRMPTDMAGWENEPFLRIRLFEPQGDSECGSRLKWLVDSILTEGRIPGGIELVFQAIMALVGDTGIDATILKPETQRRKLRYPVRDMAGWSEGERTTVAILLYCTLVKIRSLSRSSGGGENQVSALLLDNPLGACSKPEFLQMQRQIAGQLGIQLIYATGINDPPALGVFPNWLRLAKNRRVPETGELAVGLLGQNGDSMMSGIRIFEDQAKVQV
jgi:hypothetical protein